MVVCQQADLCELGKILEVVREEFFHDLAQVSLIAGYLHGGVSAFSIV